MVNNNNALGEFVATIDYGTGATAHRYEHVAETLGEALEVARLWADKLETFAAVWHRGALLGDTYLDAVPPARWLVEARAEIGAAARARATEAAR